jgi:regulator of nonsense transcripts 1
MEGAFTHVGNHLVSDSASAINAGDDLSALDPDETLLDREYGKGNLSGGPRRRRHDDEETDVLEDDDLESMASMPVNGKNSALGPQVQEEIELPPHACA